MPDLWLGHRIVTEMHRGGELKTRSTLNVVDLEIDNVPDELFLYKFEPGVKISDMRHFAPNADGGTPVVGYRVPADPAEFETVAAKAVETQKRFNLADAQETGTIRWLLLGSNVLVGMIIVAVVLHLRRRRVTK